ncbi:cytochrome P450 [Fomitopsis serialis]|uniref:cytochrome P450 n=1 Tax=Fomitopsis serialis TaxID=139415 RepID=UPI002008C95E|nr:cytochrome P450 [Neoantrodia serialis]KAH9918271.1 cytochrome P450 [Neoantrodia serialis]
MSLLNLWTVGLAPRVLGVLFAAVLASAVYLRSRGRVHKVYPPGPPRRWIVGNLLDIPSSVDLTRFKLWKDTYGDVVYLNALGYSILVLNTARAINDLLAKRGENYSHRPIFVMSGELMGLNKCMALVDYNARYKRLRTLTHRALNPDAIKKYYPIQEELTLSYMQSLVSKPDEFLVNLRLTLGRVILAVTYGMTVETADSEYIAEAEDTLNTIGKATLPGAYLVDLIPALKFIPPWLPFTSFLREAEAGRRQIYDFVTRPFEYVKRHMDNSPPPSFVADLLAERDLYHDMEDLEDIEDGIKWVAGTMYGGGMESSFATVSTFYLLMARHPDKQKRAQQEIDSLLEGRRLPKISDRESLPYVRALIQEVMRWHVVVPLGIARRTVSDDHYKVGYYIPADTVVVPNIWALAHADDEEDHTAFLPERFLRTDLPTDPSEYVFGFGRRICPGRYLADNSLFLLISNTLALFDILPPSGASEQSALSSVVTPEKFRCDIRPRSEACVELIEEALAGDPLRTGLLPA